MSLSFDHLYANPQAWEQKLLTKMNGNRWEFTTTSFSFFFFSFNLSKFFWDFSKNDGCYFFSALTICPAPSTLPSTPARFYFSIFFVEKPFYVTVKELERVRKSFKRLSPSLLFYLFFHLSSFFHFHFFGLLPPNFFSPTTFPKDLVWMNILLSFSAFVQVYQLFFCFFLFSFLFFF